MQALLDNDPNQTTQSSTMINLNNSLIEKRPEWAKRHGEVILLHDNAPSHTSKLAKVTLKSLGWDILPSPSQSFDLAPPITSLLTEQHFRNFEEVGNWYNECFAAKQNSFFFWRGSLFITYLEDDQSV